LGDLLRRRRLSRASPRSGEAIFLIGVLHKSTVLVASPARWQEWRGQGSRVPACPAFGRRRLRRKHPPPGRSDALAACRGSPKHGRVGCTFLLRPISNPPLSQLGLATPRPRCDYLPPPALRARGGESVASQDMSGFVVCRFKSRATSGDLRMVSIFSGCGKRLSSPKLQVGGNGGDHAPHRRRAGSNCGDLTPQHMRRWPPSGSQ